MQTNLVSLLEMVLISLASFFSGVGYFLYKDNHLASDIRKLS